jgi:hypothetical protein
MSHIHRVSGVVLALAARQTYRSHLLNVDFFGYFVLANSGRATYDRACAETARVNPEMQIPSGHKNLSLEAIAA